MQNTAAQPAQRPAARPRPAGGRLQRIIKVLSPGLITGAADDDPSAVGTYSVVGAQLGTAILWTALITWPLIAAIQMACARIGMSLDMVWPGRSEKNFRDLSSARSRLPC